MKALKRSESVIGSAAPAFCDRWSASKILTLFCSPIFYETKAALVRISDFKNKSIIDHFMEMCSNASSTNRTANSDLTEKKE